jgi:phosphorylcholine metabolism protein LicD
MENLKITDKKTVSILYQIIYDIHTLLEKNNIPYFLCGGTALGAIRHGGIIPWDDDIDIGVEKKFEEQLYDLEGQLEKCGLRMINTYFGFKIFYKKIKPKYGQDYSYPNLDIFLYHWDAKKKIYCLSEKEARNQWKKDYYLIDELYPLVKYDFGKLKVWGAYNYKPYLSRSYGDWMNVAYRDYDHEREEILEKILTYITDEDRKPAYPTKIKKKRCLK